MLDQRARLALLLALRGGDAQVVVVSNGDVLRYLVYACFQESSDRNCTLQAFTDGQINTPPIGDWDVEAVTDFSFVFAGAAAFSQDISK